MKWPLVAAGVVVGLVVVVTIIVTTSDGDEAAAPEQTPSPNPSGVLPATMPAAPNPADGYLGADESMKRFFQATPPPPTDPTAPLASSLVGKWHATIVALPIDPGEPAVDLSGAPGFDFEIVDTGGQVALRSLDGKGQPRQLVTAGQQLLAKADGGPDLQLTLREQVLVGEMAVGTPGTARQGRMVFHASRIP